MAESTVKQIILETPNQTTTFAHQLDSETLSTIVKFAGCNERLFAHVCLFAIAKTDTAAMFAELLLNYMQAQNDDDHHSLICLFL